MNERIGFEAILYPKISPHIGIRWDFFYTVQHFKIIISTNGGRRLRQNGDITESELGYRQIIFTVLRSIEVSARYSAVLFDYLFIKFFG